MRVRLQVEAPPGLEWPELFSMKVRKPVEEFLAELRLQAGAEPLQVRLEQRQQNSAIEEVKRPFASEGTGRGTAGEASSKRSKDPLSAKALAVEPLEKRQREPLSATHAPTAPAERTRAASSADVEKLQLRSLPASQKLPCWPPWPSRTDPTQQLWATG
jgi:hypothetical protein